VPCPLSHRGSQLLCVLFDLLTVRSNACGRGPVSATAAAQVPAGALHHVSLIADLFSARVWLAASAWSSGRVPKAAALADRRSRSVHPSSSSSCRSRWCSPRSPITTAPPSCSCRVRHPAYHYRPSAGARGRTSIRCHRLRTEHSWVIALKSTTALFAAGGVISAAWAHRASPRGSPCSLLSRRPCCYALTAARMNNAVSDR